MAAGRPRATIGFARFPRMPSKRTCLATFVESHENAAAKFRVGNREPPTPATTPIAWEASSVAPGLEDPAGPTPDRRLHS